MEKEGISIAVSDKDGRVVVLFDYRRYNVNASDIDDEITTAVIQGDISYVDLEHLDYGFIYLYYNSAYIDWTKAKNTATNIAEKIKGKEIRA